MGIKIILVPSLHIISVISAVLESVRFRASYRDATGVVLWRGTKLSFGVYETHPSGPFPKC